MAFNEARFHEQLEMPRNARLRLAEDMDQLGHGDFGFAEEGEQSQAGDLASRFQPGQNRGEWRVEI
jgi:hypothetical protein